MDSSPVWRQLLLQAALILVNAFFAAAEIAILSLNENKLKYEADEGNSKALKLLKVVKNPTVYLSTIQVAITVAGFLGSAFAADNFASRLTKWLINDIGLTGVSEGFVNKLSVILITLLLSFFTLVFGELVPKRIAMKKTDAMVKLTYSVVHFLSVILKPVTFLLSISTSAILHLFGIKNIDDENDVSEEEIRMMVDIGEETGAIEPTEKEFIENIFEFNNQSAEDVMTHRTEMESISIDSTEDEILALIEETGLSRYPVYGEDVDDIIGVLTARDFLINIHNENPKPLKDILRDPFFVPSSIKTDLLLSQMKAKKNHIAIVIDDYGGVMGLVTMEDLLECIVGNIYDEYDTEEEKPIVKLNDNLWEIEGSADISDVCEALDIDIPENEDYDTLSGLILYNLHAIPEDNTTFNIDIDNLHIEVTEVDERRILKTRVSKIESSEE